MSEFNITKVASLNVPVDDARAVPYKHDNGEEWIYVAGGVENEDHAVSDVQRFNPENYAVETYTTLPEANSHQVTGLIDGLIYYVSGANTPNIYAFDPEANTFTQRASLSYPIADHMGGVLNGKIYFWGGVDTSTSPATNLTDIYEYDPSDDSVTQIGTMDQHRRDGGATNYNNRLYQIGGEYGGGDWFSDIFRVHPDGTYEQVGNLSLNGNNQTLGRVRPTAVGGYIYTVGGVSDSERPLDDVFQFDDSWKLDRIGTVDRAIEDTQVAHSDSTGNVYELGGGDSTTSYAEIWEIEFPFAPGVIMLDDHLAIRGESDKTGDRAVLHTDTIGRAEDKLTPGDEVVLVREYLGQG